MEVPVLPWDLTGALVGPVLVERDARQESVDLEKKKLVLATLRTARAFTNDPSTMKLCELLSSTTMEVRKSVNLLICSFMQLVLGD